MDSLTFARAIHVLSIVIWIGGVTFVTIVLIPVLRRASFKHDQLSIFNAIENQFSSIARAMVILAGLSGIYMTYRLEAWGRFLELRNFWMSAMVFVWTLFLLALFIIEPFFLKDHGRLVKNGNSIDGLKKTQVVHLTILILSLITISISVMGAHGFFTKI